MRAVRTTEGVPELGRTGIGLFITCGSGGMSGNHDPAPGALWGDDQLRTVVEQTCCSAFRMDALLIWGKLEASLYFWPIKEAVVSAAHHKGQVCQIINDCPIAILAIETDEGR